MVDIGNSNQWWTGIYMRNEGMKTGNTIFWFFSLNITTGIFQYRMCCCKPCNRHPERRAGYIVKAIPVAEFNSSRVSAMLTADAYF